MIIRPDENMPNRPTARSIVRTIQLIAYPVDPVMPIILPIIMSRIHSIIRGLDDPFTLSVGRPSPTFHPIVRPTDDPTILPLIHPIIRAFDDPFILSVGRLSPTFHPIIRPTDDPTILPLIHPIICAFDDLFILSDPAIRPIIHPNDDLFILSDPAFHPIINTTDDPIIQSVRRPSPSQSDPSVNPTLYHGIHPNRLPDLTPNSLESSEEGYSTAMSEWPALLHTEKVTFLFQHLSGLPFKPPAGLGPEIMKDPPPNHSFLTWPAD